MNLKKQFNTEGLSDVFYSGIRDSDNNIVMSGYSHKSVGNELESHHIILKTDTAGEPTVGIQLDLAAGTSGFREIVELQNSYYAVGVVTSLPSELFGS